jgi:hypothetical protein
VALDGVSWFWEYMEVQSVDVFEVTALCMNADHSSKVYIWRGGQVLYIINISVECYTFPPGSSACWLSLRGHTYGPCLNLWSRPAMYFCA